MSAYWRCDACGETREPQNLRKIVALMAFNASKLVFEIPLHKGEICTNCVEAIKAVLPQEHPENIEGQHAT